MTRARIATGSALIAMALVWPSPAAGEAGEALARGQELVRAFEYDEALATLQSVVEDAGASAPQRLEALARIAAIHDARGDGAEARAALERLLDLDPGHRLEERTFSPRVRGLLEEVRASHEASSDILFETSASAADAAPGHVILEARLVGDAAGVDEVVAFVRVSAAGDFQPRAMSRSGEVYSVDVLLPEDGLDYYVEARAPSGHVLAGRGSAEDPERFEPALDEPRPVEEPEDEDVDLPPQVTPWYASWWFWTIVGVVVVGGTTTAVVLTLPEEGPSPTLGSGRLE